MKTLVTGAAGRLGRAVVADLTAHGHEVVGVDRRVGPEPDPPGAWHREVDLLDVGQVAGALAGCDAVVHLGAIPAPGRQPDETVFRNNTGATFAVLHAAALLGVRKAVVASSLSALGTAWAEPFLTPRYAPVDEAHPLLVEDAYGLSKEVDERTAEMFHRRTGMQILAFRFCWITTMDEARAAAETDRADPAAQARVLWSYVDVRDAATACRLGLEADGLGFEPFNIVAADTLSQTPTEDLIRRHAPETELRAPIPGTTSAFSIEKARRLLGWEPSLTWRAE